ncbi:MAG: cupin domain-containing protein [Eggerthellaceae bacterium]|nr:cupin domain-containing protein [Eggerthellaceae bacterium]
MLIDFPSLGEATIEGMEGGEGAIAARMVVNAVGRFVECRILPGSSIGEHAQKSGSDVNFVVSGHGHAICDGECEKLAPGTCHVCPRGSSHAIFKDGDEDLVLWTVVM